jgi:hypothetical protein
MAESTGMSLLHALADLASVVTAGVAVVAYGSYRLTLRQRENALVKLLATKTAPNDNSLTLQQLAASLKLTEGQVIEAASKSKVVEGWGGQLGNETRFRLVRNSN